MNEPKKRGRPTNAERAARQAVAEPVINGDTSREPEDVLPTKAQGYAQRVWNGQSPELPRSIRLARVKAALEGQGMSMDGVSL